MSSYTILMPNIDEISLTPNPVTQNSNIMISIGVSEITVELTPEIKYAGEFYSGEVWC